MAWPRSGSHPFAFTLLCVLLLARPAPARADDPKPGPAKPPPVAPAPSPAPSPAPPHSPDASAADVPQRARLDATVAHLAGEELAGRGSSDDRERASQWIAEAFDKLGLKPVPGFEGRFVPFPAKEGRPGGRNVVGWIPGRKEAEYVIVSAHFDHLGRVEGQVHPGADDNATGVAAMLEIARCLASGARPERSVLLVAFDLEEQRLIGSRAFVAAPPMPLEGCAAFVTIDMLGRSLGDLFPGLLLAMGAERADGLDRVLTTAKPTPGVTLRELGMDFNQLGWSDYVPFEERKIPCLFFTSGACRDYHRPTDTADRIDGAALEARTRAILGYVRALADLPERPVWKDAPAPRLREVETIHALVAKVGEKEAELGMTEGQKMLRKGFEKTLAETIARGTLTPGERVAIRIMSLQMLKAATTLK